MANHLITFARLAHDVARAALPERAHRFAPKRYTQPQLLACLLVKEYLRLDYRTAQETLELSDGLRDALGLTAVPDYSTLWRFAHDKATADVVATALAETVARFKGTTGHDPPGAPPLVAVDSTGLWTGRASRYFKRRKAESTRRHFGQRSWEKWAVAFWTGPQLVVSQLAKRGPAGDYPDLPPLAEAAVALLPGATVLADAGYDCEGDHRFCRERLGVRALIPAKTRRYVAVSRTPYRGEMARALGCERLGLVGEEGALRTYRQRWKVEALMAVVKRKWGEAVTARQAEMQHVQVLLRGLVYNLYRLVGLGVEPTT